MGLLGSAFEFLRAGAQSIGSGIIDIGAAGLAQGGGFIGDIGVALGGGSIFEALGKLNDVTAAPNSLPTGTEVGPRSGNINQNRQLRQLDFAGRTRDFSQPLFPLLPGAERAIFGDLVEPAVTPGRVAATPGDRRMAALGSGRQITSGAAGPAGFTPARFRLAGSGVSVTPIRELHAINPVTGRLETWLHAGRPTSYSRVNVKRRRHHHHPR